MKIPTGDAKALYRARCKRLGIRVTKLGMRVYVQLVRQVEKGTRKIPTEELDLVLGALPEDTSHVGA